MNTKNLTTILGGVFLAIGPQIQQQLSTSTSWWAGSLASLIGALLIALRGVIKTPEGR